MLLPTLQKQLLHLTQQAGKAILEIYQKSRQYLVQIKPDNSPLTQADLIAHEILTTGLQALTPDLPVLSEEGVGIPWEERQKWDRYWLIDPLDGTLPFLRHSGEFTVNIALIQNHQPVIGILYVPVTQEVYYACAEWGGAYKQDTEEGITQLQVRPWHPDETILLTSQAAREEKIQTLFGHLGAYTQIKMSSAWKFGWLAEGKADLAPRLGDTCEWDTAAGQCILELAGGALVGLQGQPLRYNTKASLINPYFIALGDKTHLYGRIFGTN